MDLVSPETDDVLVEEEEPDDVPGTKFSKLTTA